MSYNNSNCMTLSSAVKVGNCTKIEELLNEYGLTVDDNWIDYEIMLDAVRTGNSKIIQLLLNYGCRVNKPRANVYSPLHLAVDKNCPKIVKILLEHGASAKAKCEDLTPLHITIKSKSAEVVKLLLAHNANVCAKDFDDYTPIHRAFVEGPNCYVILDLMLAAHEGKMTNSIEDTGLSIFHIACTRNQPKVVENFLKANVDVDLGVNANAERWTNFRGLHFAAMHNQADVVRVLLKYNANVHALCAHGISALWLALKYSFDDEIAYKLNASLVKNKTTCEEVGVSVKKMMKFMSTEIKKLETIQLLVENKSNLNLVNENGRPLLFEACHPKLVMNISDKVRNKSVIESICNRFFIESRKKTMNILISHGIDLNVVDKDKNTILHHIAGECSTVTGSIEIAEMILTKGCKVNTKNKKGETPLHVAVKNGFREFINLLLKHKANPNITDKKSRTPLQYAKDEDIVDLLINSGAAMISKDKKGCTPSMDVNSDDGTCCIS